MAGGGHDGTERDRAESPGGRERDRLADGWRPRAVQDEYHREDGDRYQRGPVVPAGERQVVGGPRRRGQPGNRVEGRYQRPVVVKQRPRDQEETRDPGAGGPAEELRQREREPAEREGHQFDPQRQSHRGLHGDLVTRELRECRPGQPSAEREDDQHGGQQCHVRGDLLDRDAAPAQRGRGDEVETAATRLAGQRAGQDQDRPEGGDHEEDRAVLPLHVPTHGPDIDRLAGHSLAGGAQPVGEPDQLVPGRLGGVGVGDPGEHHEQQAAQERDLDEEGPAGVADRLTEDAAQPEQPAVPGDRRDRRDRRETGDVGGHRVLTSAASRLYSARNASSRLGSRDTKSSSSKRAAVWTTGVIEPATRIRSVWSSTAISDTPGRPANSAAGTLPTNRSSTWWWARSRRLSTRPVRTSRPSRMIATRSQVRSTSDRTWLDRKMVRPSAC